MMMRNCSAQSCASRTSRSNGSRLHSGSTLRLEPALRGLRSTRRWPEE